MAGTRRPDGVSEKEALFVGCVLGFFVGVCAGVLACSWSA